MAGDAPKRIQRSRAKGWRMPPGTIAVSRGTMWGNPFAHRDSAIAVRMFRCWLRGSVRTADLLDCRLKIPGPLGGYRERMLAELPMLAGRDLCCWCRLDRPCHADVLLELANAPLRCDPV
jgi:hypothetical protein